MVRISTNARRGDHLDRPLGEGEWFAPPPGVTRRQHLVRLTLLFGVSALIGVAFTLWVAGVF